MKNLIMIIRVIIIAFALATLLGYEHGLIFTISLLGALNIIYGMEFYKSKQKGKAISSVLMGVCILLLAVVQLI